MMCFCIWGPLKSHGRGFRLNWSLFVFMAHAPSGPAFQHIQSVVWTNIFPEIKLCSKTPGCLIFTNLNNFYAHYQFTLPFFPCHVWSYEVCVFCFSSLPFVLLWKHWRFLSPNVIKDSSLFIALLIFWGSPWKCLVTAALFPSPFWKRWSCVFGLVISLLFSTNLVLDLVSCLYLHLWGNCVISWCLIPCDIRSYIMWLVADGCRKWHQSLAIQLCPLHLLRWIMVFF